MKKLLVLVSLIALSFVFSGITYAAETTGTLNVNANVVGICTVTTQPVEFIDVTGESDVTDESGNVIVNCPQDQGYNIALDAGGAFDNADRNVEDGTGTYTVRYTLYKDSSYATVSEWGDSDYDNTYQWGSSLGDSGTGSDQSHTVYAKLYAFTGIPAGTTLTDAVTVTVHY